MNGFAGFWIFLGMLALSFSFAAAPSSDSVASALAAYFNASAKQIEAAQ